MFSAAELIHALQRRLQLVAPHLRRPPGEFPPGWQAWFASMHERVGAVTGATSDAIAGVFLQRPLSTPPPRAGELTRWRAFTTLWRQQWHDQEGVDRRLHWTAATITVLWHIFFGAALLYLMYLRFMAVSVPPPQGEEVVMVEYIGKGTPEEPGGGPGEPLPQSEQAPAPTPPQPAEPSASAAPATANVPPPPLPELEAPVPEVVQRDVPEPQLPPPTPVVEQPVTVSEPTPAETTAFVLPPTRRQVQETKLAAPELSVPTPSVRQTEVAEPVQPIRRELPQTAIATPVIRQRVPEVTEREVAIPLPLPSVREVQQRPQTTPQLQQKPLEVRTAEIPAPRPAPPAPVAAAPAPASTPTQTPSQAPTSAAPATSAPSTRPTASTAPATAAPAPAPTTGARAPAAAGPGAGPKPTPAPGTWSTPARADDWGQSTRNAPGGQRGQTPGVYNSDGSVRLAETPGSASPAQPPGTVTEEIKDLDRSGTWLKRKPNDFEPTSFEKYWVPSETLLAEWVRKGIKKVLIPIPGTNKRIECVVSMLGLGGGCGISDPNLNDQPAEARPPPDIPFKPHLQEDNGSVRK